jgi:repressor LexA
MAKRKPSQGRPPIDEITEAQRRTLCEIQSFIAHKKYPPSRQELADALGITPASVQELIVQLERKGYVRQEPRKPRSLAVLRPADEHASELLPVPLLGTVQAGTPVLAKENIIGEVLVESNVAKRGRCFAWRVTGDSMKGAGLLDGYMVIVRQQPVAENGDIVPSGGGRTHDASSCRARPMDLQAAGKNFPSRDAHLSSPLDRWPAVYGPSPERCLAHQVANAGSLPSRRVLAASVRRRKSECCSERGLVGKCRLPELVGLLDVILS